MSCCLQGMQQALPRYTGKLRAARALPWRHRGSRLVLRLGVPALLGIKHWGLRITYNAQFPGLALTRGRGGGRIAGGLRAELVVQPAVLADVKDYEKVFLVDGRALQ